MRIAMCDDFQNLTFLEKDPITMLYMMVWFKSRYAVGEVTSSWKGKNFSVRFAKGKKKTVRFGKGKNFFVRFPKCKKKSVRFYKR